MNDLQNAQARLEALQAQRERDQASLRSANVLVWLVILAGCAYQTWMVTRGLTSREGSNIPVFPGVILDPIAIATLAVTVLYGQTLAAYGEREGAWLYATRWLASLATIGLNVLHPLSQTSVSAEQVYPAAVTPVLMTLLIEGAAHGRVKMGRILGRMDEQVQSAQALMTRLQSTAEQERRQRQENEAAVERERRAEAARQARYDAKDVAALDETRRDKERAAEVAVATAQASAAAEAVRVESAARVEVARIEAERIAAAERAQAERLERSARLEAQRRAAAAKEARPRRAGPGAERETVRNVRRGVVQEQGGRRRTRMSEEDLREIEHELAEQIRRGGSRWAPDYATLEATYGKRRAWAEVRVRNARVLVRGDERVHLEPEAAAS